MAARGNKRNITECYGLLQCQPDGWNGRAGGKSLTAGIEREIEELDRQIKMEMAVYSGVEYIAAKTEKD